MFSSLAQYLEQRAVIDRELTCADFIESGARRHKELAYWRSELERHGKEWIAAPAICPVMPGTPVTIRLKPPLNDAALRASHPERLDWSTIKCWKPC